MGVASGLGEGYLLLDQSHGQPHGVFLLVGVVASGVSGGLAGHAVTPLSAHEGPCLAVVGGKEVYGVASGGPAGQIDGFGEDVEGVDVYIHRRPVKLHEGLFALDHQTGMHVAVEQFLGISACHHAVGHGHLQTAGLAPVYGTVGDELSGEVGIE